MVTVYTVGGNNGIKQMLLRRLLLLCFSFLSSFNLVDGFVAADVAGIVAVVNHTAMCKTIKLEKQNPDSGSTSALV